MKKLIQCSISTTILLLLTLSALPIIEISVDDTHFDHIVFTQFWAPESCRDLGEHCKFANVSAMWSIHGLWPSINNTNEPEHCTNATFNVSLLTDDMLKFMDKYWYTYVKFKENPSFWEHEWVRHGTCAVDGDRTVFPDQRSYFQQTIGAYKTYNISLILSKANILPGMEKSYDEFQNAFKSSLGHSVGLVCESTYLSELEICLDNSMKVIDCTRVGCSPKKPINYIL